MSHPDTNTVALHPYWCDECGSNAPFTIRGCEIPHWNQCSRAGEDAELVFRKAVEYVKLTGKPIP